MCHAVGNVCGRYVILGEKAWGHCYSGEKTWGHYVMQKVPLQLCPSDEGICIASEKTL